MKNMENGFHTLDLHGGKNLIIRSPVMMIFVISGQDSMNFL